MQNTIEYFIQNKLKQISYLNKDFLENLLLCMKSTPNIMENEWKTEYNSQQLLQKFQ